MKKSFLLIFTLLFCVALSARTSRGFSFQGYARSADGTAIENKADLQVRFSLLIDADGSPEFSEEQTLSTDEMGIFQAIIGSKDTTNFKRLDFVNFDYTLKVEVLDGSEYQQVAKKLLLAVPYAKAADNAVLAQHALQADNATNAENAEHASLASEATVANNVVDGGNGVPVGSILPFAGNSVPAGWLLCNGTPYNGNDATYAKLYSAIGLAWGGSSISSFRVPDLRGQFLRGVSAGTAIDPDRSSRYNKYTGGNDGDLVGSYQYSENKSHSHMGNTNTTGNHNHKDSNDSEHHFSRYGYVYDDNTWTTQGVDNQGGDSDEEINLGYFIQAVDAGNHYHNFTTGYTGLSESRPTNAYVNYIIKY